MSSIAILPEILSRLSALAAVLIPPKGDKPGAADIADLDRWLTRAIRACGYKETDLQAALDGLASHSTLVTAEALASAEPEAFAMLSTLVSAAYFMSPEVLTGFGFPQDRRNPAGVEDFMAEFETGIYEPVLAREPMFRDPRTKGTK